MNFDEDEKKKIDVDGSVLYTMELQSNG